MKLEQLREIASNKTKAQWVYEPERYSAKCVIGQQGDDRWIAHFLPEGNGEANAKFSVTMANHIDALLDVVEAVKSSLDGQHEWLETYCDAGAPDDCDHCVIVGALAKLEAVE